MLGRILKPELGIDKKRSFDRLVFFSLFIFLSTVSYSRPGYSCTTCSMIYCEASNTADFVTEEHNYIREYMGPEFNDLETFIQDILVERYILPMIDALATPSPALSAYSMGIIGTFFDAKNQLEVERMFQELSAEAHKDYLPSVGVCKVGTLIRSLAAAEQTGGETVSILAKRSLDRHLGRVNSAASEGVKEDVESRFEQFRNIYCKGSDFGADFAPLCLGTNPARYNRDVDYGLTVDDAMTLNIAFGDSTLNDTEEDIWALSNNLYGSRVLQRIPEVFFLDEDKQQAILDQRSVIAKRSVAENSFNTIVGMKTPGSLESADASGVNTTGYMNVVLEQLGIAADEATHIYGERPSYYAQMDFLTKKVYQDPNFYTNLYDTPVNIDRKRVTLQAIGLMQDFDTLESYLRTEAMLSVLLELEVNKLQRNVQGDLSTWTTSGKRN